VRAALRLEVLTDLAAAERLLPEWRELAATSARSPLEAPDWLLPLARRYLAGYGTRFLAWRDGGGELVGVAPLSMIGDRPPIRPIRQLAWWGSVGPRMRGLVDIVARDDAREQVTASFADWLAGEREWDVLRILRPQVGSITGPRLADQAKAAGWAYAPYSNLRSTTYQLKLPSTVPEWEVFLKPKTRATARREARWFEAERGGELVPVLEHHLLGEGLDAVERLLRERWGESEVYFAPDAGFRALLHEAVPAMAARQDAWVSVARDADGINACLVTTAQHGYAMALLVAASDAETLRKYSLGKHVFKMGIGEAVRRGCHTYDFLWVGGYKQSFWHAEPQQLHSAMVGRGFIGRPLAGFLARRESSVVAAPGGGALPAGTTTGTT
jgi:CelD/BcsL family acetyltransferase involved in cellulose biosynthesis